MALVKEFNALRFANDAGAIKDLCCPPYDIISDTEKGMYYAKDAHNIINLELPGQQPEDYVTAKNKLNEWMNYGVLKQDTTPALYIYEEKFSVKGVDYAFKGFTAYVKLEEFSKGIVLPHEETLSKAKTDRFNLLNATGCSFSQIYSLYNDKNGETQKLINELSSGAPDISFTDGDGVTHNLWVAEKSDKTEQICRQFDDRKLYIADGHHRYETGLNFRNYLKEQGIANENSEYIMMFLVNMENDGLVVFPTHRIVRDLETFDSAELIKKCEKYFTTCAIEKDGAESFLDTAYAKGETAFVFYDGATTVGLTLKDASVMDNLFPDKSVALRQLDVNVLHSLILEELLGIDKENMAKQINLTYTRSLDEAISAADNAANCCFLLNPTRVSEIADVAAAGEKMPQKSTYFYPKLITGLVINKII
ncbi:MAG: DUF1015 domain-containing protein [Clostridia bacterium]|nr:DUF1015 domain-containing protein [Clostridia bacterium]